LSPPHVRQTCGQSQSNNGISTWAWLGRCVSVIWSARYHLSKEKKRIEKSGVKNKWLLKRNQYSHVNLIRELKIVPIIIIQKQHTVMRNAKSPHERLTATLRFLATGRTYECLTFSYNNITSNSRQHHSRDMWCYL